MMFLKPIKNMKAAIIIILCLFSTQINAQTIAPLPTITKSVFAQTNEPVQFTTASSTGNSTFWNGLVSISSTGNITGTGTMESYSSNGTKAPAVNVTFASGSQISSTTLNLTATNVRTLDFGYSSGGVKIRCADYFADVKVKLSNGFIATGKCAYQYRYVYQKSGNYDDSGVGFKLNITGSGGHIGFITTGSFNN